VFGVFSCCGIFENKKPAEISEGYIKFLVPKAGLENLEKSLLVTCRIYSDLSDDPILLHTQVCKCLAFFNDLGEVFFRPLDPKKLHGLPLFVKKAGRVGISTADGIAAKKVPV
jgi:hypothetical protein